MHVLFIHPNFPAQFGHLAHHMATRLGWECTCVTSVDTTHLNLPFTHINYKIEAGPQPKTFYNPSSLDGMMQHLIAVYRGLKGVTQLNPDLVVGHISYGTWLYLRNLYDCPFVGYYEVLPPPFWTDKLSLRKEYPPPEGVRLFNATYHALTYLHLHAMDAGYTPTNYQLSTCPPELQYKLKVIHDGIDTEACRPFPVPRPTNFHGVPIPEGPRVVTYVSRGLESLRGFDIFMEVAGRIVRERPDTIFLIAGDERTNYGHDLHHIGNTTFKNHICGQFAKQFGDDALKNFHFLGLIPTSDLATMLNLGDLHIYFTAPFVLSWSMLQAMSCGCLVLGSNTAPVEEVIKDGVNGLMADFQDYDGLAKKALQALADPAAHKPLREAARQTILDKYSVELCLKQLVDFFEDTVKAYPERRKLMGDHAGRPAP